MIYYYLARSGAVESHCKILRGKVPGKFKQRFVRELLSSYRKPLFYCEDTHRGKELIQSTKYILQFFHSIHFIFFYFLIKIFE